MKIEFSDPLWLDERFAVSFAELVELSGLAEAELRELVDCGVLTSSPAAATDRTFSGYCVAAARTARRLRDDFELDTKALAISLLLLERIHELEIRCRELQARTPHVPQ